MFTTFYDQELTEREIHLSEYETFECLRNQIHKDVRNIKRFLFPNL